ncbi:MAG: OB-fold domain-containing protein [Ectothiorhodospiraceae bacterium]|nr:OB-fold domain-containing protein [Ectothiorhodospiraceae bacterium]
MRVQRCRACAGLQLPPRARCRACGADTFDWATLPPRGVVYSFTIVHRAPTPAFRDDVPYVLALVEVAPGARLMLNVVDCEASAMGIGAPVDIGFEPREADGATAFLPVARLSPATDPPDARPAAR